LNEPDFLSLEEVIAIHDDQLLRYGGRPGILDMARLQTAVAVPTTGAGGDYFHTDIFLMAAAYLYHISQDHPFVDGNKRTGVVAAIVFLYLNGLRIETEELDLEEMVISVAEGRTDKPAIARFFQKNTVGLE
jgi:death on curing protein